MQKADKTFYAGKSSTTGSIKNKLKNTKVTTQKLVPNIWSREVIMHQVPINSHLTGMHFKNAATTVTTDHLQHHSEDVSLAKSEQVPLVMT